MNIISRKEAKVIGSKTYYTGEVCKNGHLSYRYTQSGSCKECINGSPGTYDSVEKFKLVEIAREETAKKLEIVRKREAISSRLAEVRVRVYDVDHEAMRTAAWALSVMQYPILTEDDTDPGKRPTDRVHGSAMYFFRCTPDDMPTLMQIADQMFKNRSRIPSLEIESKREAIVAAELAKIVDTTPPENYK